MGGPGQQFAPLQAYDFSTGGAPSRPTTARGKAAAEAQEDARAERVEREKTALAIREVARNAARQARLQKAAMEKVCKACSKRHCPVQALLCAAEFGCLGEQGLSPALRWN